MDKNVLKDPIIRGGNIIFNIVRSIYEVFTGSFFIKALVYIVFVVTFPYYPLCIRGPLYTFSMTALTWVTSLMVLNVFRGALFLLLWIASLGKVQFWLLPNLGEYVSFWESFKPFTSIDYQPDFNLLKALRSIQVYKEVKIIEYDDADDDSKIVYGSANTPMQQQQHHDHQQHYQEPPSQYQTELMQVQGQEFRHRLHQG